MNEYELIYEALEDAVASGEIDIEFAEAVNDIAYDKYLDELDDEYEESAAVNKIYDKHKKQATEYYKKFGSELYGKYHNDQTLAMNDKGSSLHKAVQHDTYAKNLERYSTRPEDRAIKGYIRNMRNHTDEVVPHPFNKDKTFRNLRPDEKIRVLADEGRRKKALLNRNSGFISSYKDSLTLPDKPALTKKEIRTREKAMKKLKKKY